MAITESSLYGLTLEKFLIDTAGQSLEAEDNNIMLTNDTETPNFDTDDFRNDVTEVTGTNWAAGGVALTGTAITLASGVLTLDATDVSESNTTIADAMASVLYTTVGSDSTDQLVCLHDFVSAVSTTAGTFAITWNASGLFTVSYNPA